MSTEKLFVAVVLSAVAFDHCFQQLKHSIRVADSDVADAALPADRNGVHGQSSTPMEVVNARETVTPLTEDISSVGVDTLGDTAAMVSVIGG